MYIIMKKYPSRIFTAIAIPLLMVNCQKIDLSPKDNLSDSQFWKGPSDFMKAVNQLYTTAESFDVKDVDSDIGYNQAPDVFSNGTWSAPTSDTLWSNRFADLRNCNKIIEKSESYAGDPKEIERYVAEARFFRAYNHWRLMKRFNDIPILTSVLSTDSEELYGKRQPQATAEDFILSELEEAASKLPKQSEVQSSELGRVTQGAALALKARVALFAGTWAKYHQHRGDYGQLLDQAIDAAKRVIESNEYQLFEGAGDDSYRQLFIDQGDDSHEGIFDSRYAKNIRMHSAAHSVYWGWRGTPTKKLADMYLCKSSGLPIEKSNSGFQGYEKISDEFSNRDPRMSQTFIMPGTNYRNANGPDSCVAKFTVRPETRTGYKLWKFMGETVAGVNEAIYDYHIIRYPEVLLILAEATFEKDGAISDNVLNQTINVIRSRKGVEMPVLSNAFVNSNALDMLTEIRRERTIELAFEGFRRDDLRRWKTAATELVKPLLGIKYKGTQYEQLKVLNDGNPGNVDANGFLIIDPANARFFRTPKHYYYPVPLDELTLNPNLLPNNPGW